MSDPVPILTAKDLDRLVELFKRGRDNAAIQEIAQSTLVAFQNAEGAVAAAKARLTMAESLAPVLNVK